MALATRALNPGAVGRVCGAALLTMSIVLGAASTASPEAYEVTERRLKSAGIDAPTREKIHAAISRATTWLASQQGESGAWLERDGPSYRGKTVENSLFAALWSDGATALSGLAMQHTGSARGEASAERALAQLLGRRRKQVSANVYAAGPTILLCQARDRPKEGQAMASWLVRSLRKRTGLWGYGTGAGPTYFARAAANLSTSQFACLGLWGGQRMGMPTPTAAWLAHLEWLLEHQVPDGSWAYGSGGANGWTSSYPTGAFMGLANLLLAKSALAHELSADADLRERTLTAESVGRAALRRYARWKLRGVAETYRWEQMFPLYGLYALEKAAVFADSDVLGATHWYRAGAERLIALQAPDGSWAGHDWVDEPKVHGEAYHGSRVVDTAFALLFLLRVSEAHAPTAVAPVTTGAPLTDVPEDTAPSAEDVERWLAEAESVLQDTSAGNDTIIERLTRAHAAYPAQGAESEDVAKRIERLLVEALALKAKKRRPRASRRRTRVNVHAARLLAQTGPRAVGPVRAYLEKRGVRKGRIPIRVDLLEACFDVLAAHGDGDALMWIVDRVIDPRPSNRAFAVNATALTSLQGFHRLPRTTRVEAARRLVRRFKGLEAAALKIGPRPGIHMGVFWRQTRPDVVIAVYDLARKEPGGRDLSFGLSATLREMSDALGQLR